MDTFILCHSANPRVNTVSKENEDKRRISHRVHNYGATAMLRSQCSRLKKERNGMTPPLQPGRKTGAVPRNPGIRHRDLATKEPAVLREQWLVQIRGAEGGVFEPQSYRGVGWIEMEGKDVPGHSSSSWKQKGGFGGARMEVTGDWRRGLG